MATDIGNDSTKINPGDLLYSLKDVSKTYIPPGRNAQRVVALHNIDLDIHENEFLCVIGRSGEGKSTLLNLLGALDRPTGGTLLYRGKQFHELGHVAFRRKCIGFVFQMFNLLPHKTALDNAALGLTMAGASRRAAKKEAAKWLSKLGLGNRLEHYPNELSGGEKQRVAIARAMVKNPEVLLADEPTGNLDKSSRVEVLDAIRNLRDEFGRTIVMVTHNQDDAQLYGSRTIRIDGGTIAGE